MLRIAATSWVATFGLVATESSNLFVLAAGWTQEELAQIIGTTQQETTFFKLNPPLSQ